MWNKPVRVFMSGLLLTMGLVSQAHAQTMPSPPSGSSPAPVYVQGPDGPVMNTEYNSSLNRPLQSAGNTSVMAMAARTMRSADKYRKKGDVETACAMAKSAVRMVAGELSVNSPVTADYQHKADEICKVAEKS